MRRKKCLLGLSALTLAIWLGGGVTHAQINPNGWINSDGWGVPVSLG